MKVVEIPETGDRVLVLESDAEMEGIVLLYHWPTDTVRVQVVGIGTVWLPREQIQGFVPVEC